MNNFDPSKWWPLASPLLLSVLVWTATLYFGDGALGMSDVASSQTHLQRHRFHWLLRLRLCYIRTTRFGLPALFGSATSLSLVYVALVCLSHVCLRHPLLTSCSTTYGSGMNGSSSNLIEFTNCYRVPPPKYTYPSPPAFSPRFISSLSRLPSTCAVWRSIPTPIRVPVSRLFDSRRKAWSIDTNWLIDWSINQSIIIIMTIIIIIIMIIIIIIK